MSCANGLSGACLFFLIRRWSGCGISWPVLKPVKKFMQRQQLLPVEMINHLNNLSLQIFHGFLFLLEISGCLFRGCKYYITMRM